MEKFLGPYQLSETLESLIFQNHLTKKEVMALKDRCTKYQDLEFRKWSEILCHPYSQYFGFLSALKAKSIMSDLHHLGYLNRFKEFDLYDIGAGTLGASLGILDFFEDGTNPIQNIHTFDVSPLPMKWAENYYAEFLKKPIIMHSHLTPLQLKRPSVIIASDVIYESQLTPQSESHHPLAKIFKNLFQNSETPWILILIDPAAKIINQNLLALRDLWKKDAPIILPCTHSQNCPALAQKEWCHEERDYYAHPWFWNLVRDLGFDRKVLQYSLLCLSSEKSIFNSNHARVVSRRIRNKGRCDRWLCGNGQRWKASIMERHESPENQNYFDARRGTILDKTSTTFPWPDKVAE